jgi:hypothetical protein
MCSTCLAHLILLDLVFDGIVISEGFADIWKEIVVVYVKNWPICCLLHYFAPLYQMLKLFNDE